MKVLGSIFLIISIVYTTIGIKINAHYCQANNSSKYSISESKSCCEKTSHCCTIIKTENDCCSDKTSLLHLGQDIHFSLEKLAKSIVILNDFKAITVPQKIDKLFQFLVIKDRAPPLSTNHKQSVLQVFII